MNLLTEVTLSILLVLMFSGSSNPLSDLEKNNIRGRVKTLSESEYEILAGKQPKKGSLKTKFISQFNDSGNVSETFVYNADGSLKRMSFFTYNTNGKLIETRVNNPDMSLGSRILYSYDDQGRIAEQDIYDYYKKLVSKTVYNWKDLHTVSLTSSLADGSQVETEVIVYDDSGKPKEEKHYTPLGKAEGTYISTYDSLKNLSSYSLFQPGMELFWKISYLYNTNGFETEEKMTDKNGTVTEKTNTTYLSIDTIHHNWTAKITYKHNKPFGITERQITYY